MTIEQLTGEQTPFTTLFARKLGERYAGLGMQFDETLYVGFINEGLDALEKENVDYACVMRMHAGEEQNRLPKDRASVMHDVYNNMFLRLHNAIIEKQKIEYKH